jgi:hypothetical protein
MEKQLISLEKIKCLLEDRRLTVVAKRVGLSYPTVQAVSKGKSVDITTHIKLSDYFNQPTYE